MWSTNDQLFREELEKGRRAEDHVADVMRNAGIEVEIPERSFRCSIAEADRYASQVDLLCGNESQKFVIEVKSRDVRFNGIYDLPRHLMPFFVTTVNSWQGCDPKPYAIVIVSQITEGMVVASGRQQPHWEIVQAYDRVRGIYERFYAAHPRYLYPIDKLIAALKATRTSSE